MITSPISVWGGPFIDLHDWDVRKQRLTVGNPGRNTSVADASCLDAQVIAHDDAAVFMAPEPGVNLGQQGLGFIQQGAFGDALVVW